MFKEFIAQIKEIINSNHPFYEILNDISFIVNTIWNYKIYVTADKQTIFVSNVVIGIILLILGFKFVKFLSKKLRKKLAARINEVGIVDSLSQLGHYFLTLLMIIFVLDVSNVPLTVFTVVGTTLAIGIGLGSQNIVNNFISGILIMIERPIKVGDIVEVKNITGEVIYIGARCTTVRTSNNIDILIPNSSILQDVVINWTHEDFILKTNMSFSINSKIEIKTLDELIMKVLKDSKSVLFEREPRIYLIDFTNDSYSIQIDFCIDLSKNIKKKIVFDEINRKLLKIFSENKVEILSKSDCCHSVKSKEN